MAMQEEKRTHGRIELHHENGYHCQIHLVSTFPPDTCTTLIKNVIKTERPDLLFIPICRDRAYVLEENLLLSDVLRWSPITAEMLESGPFGVKQCMNIVQSKEEMLWGPLWRHAFHIAQAHGTKKLCLGDRPINVSLHRLLSVVSKTEWIHWWLTLAWCRLRHLMMAGEAAQDWQQRMAQMHQTFPKMHHILIDESTLYMAHRLYSCSTKYKNIVAILDPRQAEGIHHYLSHPYEFKRNEKSIHEIMKLTSTWKSNVNASWISSTAIVCITTLVAVLRRKQYL